MRETAMLEIGILYRTMVRCLGLLRASADGMVGARAAQVVPHVHFHIIPRTPDVPEVRAKSWTIFGKGQREELDDEDAAILLKLIRQSVANELRALATREGDDVVKELLEGNNTDFLKPKL